MDLHLYEEEDRWSLLLPSQRVCVSCLLCRSSFYSLFLLVVCEGVWSLQCVSIRLFRLQLRGGGDVCVEVSAGLAVSRVFVFVSRLLLAIDWLGTEESSVRKLCVALRTNFPSLDCE